MIAVIIVLAFVVGGLVGYFHGRVEGYAGGRLDATGVGRAGRHGH